MWRPGFDSVNVGRVVKITGIVSKVIKTLAALDIKFPKNFHAFHIACNLPIVNDVILGIDLLRTETVELLFHHNEQYTDSADSRQSRLNSSDPIRSITFMKWANHAPHDANRRTRVFTIPTRMRKQIRRNSTHQLAYIPLQIRDILVRGRNVFKLNSKNRHEV